MTLIDSRAPVVSPDELGAMHAAGVRDVEGFALLSWSEKAHLATMDRHGIGSSLLSLSAQGISFMAGRAALDFAGG